MTNLWNGADSENMVIDKNGKAKKVTWVEMTKEQVKDATNNIKSDATRKIKEKIFGTDKKGRKEQSRLSKIKHKLKD